MRTHRAATPGGAGGRYPKALCGRIVLVCCRHLSKSTFGLEQRVKRFPFQQFVSQLPVETLDGAILPMVNQAR
jgi:hypothetical protein